MKCQEFENLLHGLVSGRPLDNAQQTKALFHMESCSRCSARLQNERVLANGLRALAVESREKLAPTRIENALLEAFRARENSLIPRTGLKLPVQSDNLIGVSRVSVPRTGRPNRGWLIGTVASAFLLAGIGFMYWRAWFIHPTITQIPGVSVSKNPVPSSSVREVPKEPLTVATQQAPVPKVEKGIHARQTQNPDLHKNAKSNLGSTSEELMGRREIDSDFLPLMAASPLEPTESGHLIRMNLPRSTMGRFGFPINSEQIEEPIKADVLIGEDGVARAIRFVYTAEKVPSVR